MKILWNTFLLFVGLSILSPLMAQVNTPRPSPVAEFETTIGLTEIEVEYSQPGVKGRNIFGDLVNFGEIWRTGANASTKIEFSKDVQFGGMDVPAGTYALYTIPGMSEWTVILHKNTDHWGVADYDASEDLGRIRVQPQKLNDLVETMTINVSHFDTESANLNLLWEKTKISIPIKTNAKEEIEAQIQKELIDGPDAGSYAAGARYYLSEGRNLNEALSWIDMALEKRPEAFWYQFSKAEILSKLGKSAEAKMAAQKVIDIASKNKDGDYGYIQRAKDLMSKI